MDYIRRSLDIVQGNIETDTNSFIHALNELEKRKEELTFSRYKQAGVKKA